MQPKQYIRSISPVLEADLSDKVEQETTIKEANSQLENVAKFESHQNLTVLGADTSKNGSTSNEVSSNICKKTEQNSRGRPSACVFVASLCATRSDDELCVSVTEHFQQWGKLSTVKVLRDTANRPYAFVQYGSDEDSKLAIKEGHNSVLDGRNIRCEAAKVNRTLFVLSKSAITEFFLKTILAEFGEIEKIIPSNETGNIVSSNNLTKGYKYWFCKFAYRDDAIRAFANLADNRAYRVEWAQNIEEMEGKKVEKYERENDNSVKFDKYSIFVGQLSQKISEDDLKERFELHGEISDVNIVRRPGNTFSFIRYSNESSAASAVERENHSMLNGKTMHVQYREIHSTSRGSVTNKINGIALAPPPINLNRRSSSFGSVKGNEGIYSRPINHNTYPMSNSKFNGYPSNNYNKGTAYKSNFNQGAITHQKGNTYSTNRLNNGGSLGARGKSYKFNENGYSKSKPLSKSGSNRENTPTPPPSVQTFDSHTQVKSGYSPSSAVNSERSENVKTSKNSSRANAATIPYFYYIPSAEVVNGVGNTAANKFNPPTSYFNPYQQYYIPYEPNSIPGTFGIPSFPMFYPTSGNEADFENFPLLETEK